MQRAVRLYETLGCARAEFAEQLARVLAIDPTRVILTSSGTAALEVLLTVLADRTAPVSLPAYGFVATANAAARTVGMRYFCDVDPQTGWMLVSNSSSRIVVPVAFAGNAAPLSELLLTNTQTIVMDAAAVLGQADLSGDSLSGARVAGFALSFSQTKLVSCGMGGAAVFQDPAAAAEADALVSQGGDWSSAEGEGVRAGGTNLRMGAINAAVGLVHLQDRTSLMEACAYQRSVLGSLLGPRLVPAAAGAYNVARLPYARRVAERLRAHGVPARWRYHRCLRGHVAYSADIRVGQDFGAARAENEYLYLPYGPGLGEREVDGIAELLSRYVAPEPEVRDGAA